MPSSGEFIETHMEIIDSVVARPPCWIGGGHTSREVVVMLDTLFMCLAFYKNTELTNFWGYYNEKVGRPMPVASLNAKGSYEEERPKIEEYVAVFKEWWAQLPEN